MGYQGYFTKNSAEVIFADNQGGFAEF